MLILRLTTNGKVSEASEAMSWPGREGFDVKLLEIRDVVIEERWKDGRRVSGPGRRRNAQTLKIGCRKPTRGKNIGSDVRGGIPKRYKEHNVPYS